MTVFERMRVFSDGKNQWNAGPNRIRFGPLEKSSVLKAFLTSNFKKFSDESLRRIVAARKTMTRSVIYWKKFMQLVKVGKFWQSEKWAYGSGYCKGVVLYPKIGLRGRVGSIWDRVARSWHEFHNRERLRRWIDGLKGQLISEIRGQIAKNSLRKLHYEPSNTKTSIDRNSKDRPTSLISSNAHFEYS